MHLQICLVEYHTVAAPWSSIYACSDRADTLARGSAGLPDCVLQALEDMPCPQCKGDGYTDTPCPLGRVPPARAPGELGVGGARHPAGPSRWQDDDLRWHAYPEDDPHPLENSPVHGLQEHVPIGGTWRVADHLADVAPQLAGCSELSSDDDDFGVSDRMEYVMNQQDTVATSDWYQVRHEHTAEDAVHCSPTVFQFAARASVGFLSNMMTVKAFQASLKGTVLAYQAEVHLPARQPGGDPPRPFPRGDPAPDNPYCRFPASKYACDRVLGVQPLDRYELHLCWTDGCPYWWPFSTRHQRGTCDATTNMPNPKCDRCICPRCGGRRWKQTDKGLLARRCWFMHDVLEQFLLDRDMCHGILSAMQNRDKQSATFHATARCNELRQAGLEAGFSLDKASRSPSHTVS